MRRGQQLAYCRLHFARLKSGDAEGPINGSSYAVANAIFGGEKRGVEVGDLTADIEEVPLAGSGQVLLRGSKVRYSHTINGVRRRQDTKRLSPTREA
jgi:hypothetical protein